MPFFRPAGPCNQTPLQCPEVVAMFNLNFKKNLEKCRSEKKMKNNGIPMISLRMHKWKVILENGYHKVRKDTDSVKPTPSNWAKW